MKKLAVFLFLIMLSLSVFSQKTVPKVSIERKQKVEAQKFKVVSIVEKTAEEATFWEDKEAAVKALADAADLLWDENENKSVKWLTKAWSLIDEVTETPKNESLTEFFTRSNKSDLQAAVLKVAYKHDSQLAERLIKQLTDKEPDEKKDKGAFDDKSARSEQLLNLARQTLETNPNLAFSLAQRSLADGISYSLQNILTELRKKDANLANRLFDIALSQLRTTDEAQILAGYLFKSGFTFAASSGGNTILVVNPAQQNLPAVAQSEPNRAKEFLSAAYQRFFFNQISLDTPENKRKAENTLVLGNTIIAKYDAYAPELTPPVRAYLAQLQTALYPNRQNKSSENSSKSSSLPKDATKEQRYEALIDDLEAKAENETNPIAKKIAYIRAANSTNPEDYKRGIGIAKNIDDENLQEDVVSFLLYRAALYFVDKKEIERAEELAPQIKEVLRRSVVKIAVAQSLLERQKDKKIEQYQRDLEKQRAFDLLNEVEKDLRKEDASQDTVKILLGAASVMGKFDETQALSLLEQAVQAINKTENYNLKNDSAPRLGIDISKTSSATVENPKIGFGFRSAIEPLIESNFEQIASLVERFSAKEVRGISRLEFAKLFFQKNKEYLKQK